jgi:hypothetical protein
MFTPLVEYTTPAAIADNSGEVSCEGEISLELNPALHVPPLCLFYSHVKRNCLILKIYISYVG